MSEFSNLSIVHLKYPEEIGRALAIRNAVFVVEQGYSSELELDYQDGHCQHWLATCEKDGVTMDVGSIRLWPKPDGLAKLTRMAVLSSARGLHVGLTLVQVFVKYCKENGFDRIVLHSQYPKRGFYEKCGFVIEDDDSAIFYEEGNPHVRMWMRNLQKQ